LHNGLKGIERDTFIIPNYIYLLKKLSSKLLSNQLFEPAAFNSSPIGNPSIFFLEFAAMFGEKISIRHPVEVWDRRGFDERPEIRDVPFQYFLLVFLVQFFPTSELKNPNNLDETEVCRI
jgi:hypothetical protein